MKNLFLLLIVLFSMNTAFSQDTLRYHKGSGALSIVAGISNSKDGKYFSASYTEYITNSLFTRMSFGGENGELGNIKFSSQVIDLGFGYRLYNFKNRLFLNAFTMLSTVNDDLNSLEQNRLYNATYYKLGYGIGAEVDAFICNKLVLSVSVSDRSYPEDKFSSHRTYGTIGLKYIVK
jgi:hypothetical protein